eukprot:6198566-Pleurochrysis_carterae.AAC.6
MLQKRFILRPATVGMHDLEHRPQRPRKLSKTNGVISRMAVQENSRDTYPCAAKNETNCTKCCDQDCRSNIIRAHYFTYFTLGFWHRSMWLALRGLDTGYSPCTLPANDYETQKAGLLGSPKSLQYFVLRTSNHALCRFGTSRER